VHWLRLARIYSSCSAHSWIHDHHPARLARRNRLETVNMVPLLHSGVRAANRGSCLINQLTIVQFLKRSTLHEGPTILSTLSRQPHATSGVTMYQVRFLHCYFEIIFLFVVYSCGIERGWVALLRVRAVFSLSSIQGADTRHETQRRPGFHNNTWCASLESGLCRCLLLC